MLFHVTNKAQWGQPIHINSRQYLIGDNGVIEVRHPDDLEKALRMPALFREMGVNEKIPESARDVFRLSSPEELLAEKFVAVILGSAKMRDFFRSMSREEVTVEAKRMGYDVTDASIELAVKKWIRTHPAEASAMGMSEPAAPSIPEAPAAPEPMAKWLVPEDGNWPDPVVEMPLEFLVQMAQAYGVMPAETTIEDLVSNAPPAAGLVASILAAMYSEPSDTGAAAPAISATPEASAPTGKKAGKGKKNKG